MKKRVFFFIILAVDAFLVLLCIWEMFGSRIGLINVSLFNPKGIIAAQEGRLILTSVLIMLAGVIPVYILIFFFAWKYKAGKPESKYSPNFSSKIVSVTIWLIPASVIITLSFINWKTTHALDPTKPIASDKPPLTIQVVALQWKFLFIYPQQNIATVNFIEFPVDTPLNFELTADAPMSSFWIPQLGSQIYAMAGMQTHLNLIANQTGDFNGMDTEINGIGFSGMKFVARSSSQSDFDQWVAAVKQSSLQLDQNAYNNLSQPSQNNPPAYYASVDKGLYNGIMMKFMAPAPPASTTTSSPMVMPGMSNIY